MPRSTVSACEQSPPSSLSLQSIAPFLSGGVANSAFDLEHLFRYNTHVHYMLYVH